MQSQSTIRKLLQEATTPVHQRLHHHEGLAAVASGTISRENYTSLLMRLYGFHRPFDDMLRTAGAVFQTGLNLDIRRRAVHIAQDLEALGVNETAHANLPVCAELRHPRSCAQLLGALYVIEGSTLGGLVLARALSSLFGPHGMEGRRFFYGYGEKHAVMWRDFVTQIEAHATTPARQMEIVASATQTFHDFETWMKDWRTDALSPSLRPVDRTGDGDHIFR